MGHLRFPCTQCEVLLEQAPALGACPGCGAPLDLAYRGPTPSAGVAELPGLWRYWDSLPLHDPRHIVSLGEGRTPCVPLERLGRSLGLGALFAKLEYLNPTGSFKDRGAAVLVSALKELGVSEVVEDSSGNAGASLAAYCARAGIRATIFAPKGTPPQKSRQIQLYGAEVRLVPGGRQAAADAAREHCQRQSAYYASHNLSPFFLQGMKSFAFELAEQFPGALPEHILFPVGNGSLFLGTWKGLGELQRAGRLEALPRLHCVQARACMPIVAAFQGQPWSPPRAVRTVAGGIAVVQPPRQHQVLEALSASGGAAAAVEEERILWWQRALAREEGVFCEPTSAAAFAGLETLVQKGVVAPGARVLVPVTGFGLKDRIPIP